MTPKQMARLGLFQIQEAILSVLEQEPKGLKPEEISTILGVPDRLIVQGILEKLRSEGYIEPPIEERWKIVSSNESHINSDKSHVSSDNNHIWTAEEFRKLISDSDSDHKIAEYYSSNGQIEILSELGADLQNFVKKEQWSLRPKFHKTYSAFYSGRPPYFGVDLQQFHLRLCVWLPKEIVLSLENDGKTKSENYSNWRRSTGYAIYPTSVKVADIKEILKTAYKWRRGELD